MKDFQENIVPAYNQNKHNVYLHENTGLKILFVGNSITKHAVKPEIGWERDCGMAASSIEKDYVHLIVDQIKKQYDENVAFGIAQVAEYERNLFTMKPEDKYELAAEFNADIIIMFFGANVSRDYDKMENPSKTFEEAVVDMRNYLNKDGHAKVFISEGFYDRPVLNAEKQTASKKLGDIYISLGDIPSREDTHGQYNHPGDVGMQAIADKFWEYIEPEVRRLTRKKK